MIVRILQYKINYVIVLNVVNKGVTKMIKFQKSKLAKRVILLNKIAIQKDGKKINPKTLF